MTITLTDRFLTAVQELSREIQTTAETLKQAAQALEGLARDMKADARR
jgi:hypothetical protein